MTASNPIIGTVPCPIPGCGEDCGIKKFMQAPTKPGKTPRTSRKAGRMYFDCPKHGRFGFDGKPSMQEYIVCHAKIHGKPLLAVEPDSHAAPSSEPKPASKSEPKPTPATPPRTKRGLGFF